MTDPPPLPGGFTSRVVPVLGTTMHCLDAGSGRPIVFLHGNPTSSFLWRHVLAGLGTGLGRRVAVDLIGMGGSGKPELAYHLIDHIDHVDGLIDELGLTDIVFVAHDWGVAICLEYLRRHPGRVQAVAFMEGHVRPVPSWAGFDPGGRKIFQELRTPGVGERMALEQNFLIEALLPAAVERELTSQELDEYRRPYPDPASRRPLLQWAREIPIAGQPVQSVQILDRAWSSFTTSPVRKLLLHGRPGAIIGAEEVAWCQQELPDLSIGDLGGGTHFLPEDRPEEIVRALTDWL